MDGVKDSSARDVLANDIHIVARAETAAAIEYGLSAGDISWGSCPEISEEDWKRVEEEIMGIAREIAPARELRTSAYERLIQRNEESA